MEREEYINNEKEKIEKARHIQEMMNTKGWKYVLEFKDDALESLLNAAADDEIINRHHIYTIFNDFIKRLEDYVDVELAVENLKKLK